MTKKNNENIKETQETKVEQTTVEEEQVVDVEEAVVEENVKESKTKRFVNYCKAHKKQIGLVIAGLACTAAGYALGVKVDTLKDEVAGMNDVERDRYLEELDSTVVDIDEPVKEEIIEEK